MKEYTQLTQPQRYEISALHKVGQGPTQIARIVGVHRTTISRELKRNQSPNGYYPQATHQRSQKRQQRPLKWTGRCRRLVEGKLRHEWSPAQIAGWLEQNEPFSISHDKSTSISIWIETAEVDFILTCTNTNNRSEFRPKRRIKARFPTGFSLTTTPLSSMKQLESVIGKLI
jgi:IS30 family transposase